MLDASTVEDALICHRQAVEELTLIIEKVAQSALPPERKSQILFELMLHRASHAGDVNQLEFVIRRNEQFIWAP